MSDPTPRYAPSWRPREVGVYPGSATIKPQPEHPPEVLAKAQRIPPGVASRDLKTADPFNGSTDTFGYKLEQARRARRAARQVAEPPARAPIPPRPPRTNRPCLTARIESRLLERLRRAEHPLLLTELCDALADIKRGSLQNAIRRAKRNGALQWRVLSIPGHMGTPAEYWPAGRPWPELERYRPGSVVAKK